MFDVFEFGGAEAPFVSREISEASEQVEAAPALVDDVALLKQIALELKIEM